VTELANLGGRLSALCVDSHMLCQNAWSQPLLLNI